MGLVAWCRLLQMRLSPKFIERIVVVEFLVVVLLVLVLLVIVVVVLVQQLAVER